MKEVKSSNISHIGYTDGALTVRFHSGNEYTYHGVTPQEHDDLVSAGSVGKHFQAHIKSKYDGKKKDKA